MLRGAAASLHAALASVENDAAELRRALRKSRRREQLRAAALVLPLFVFLAACSEELLARQDVRVRGRILSVVEASDEVGRSCEPLRRSAAPGTVIEELRLATGARHGAFFQPRSAWLDPVARWAAGGTP